MKKIILVIIFLTSCGIIYSQSLKLGIKADILTGNKYLSWQVGPSLTLDYSFENIPISLQGTTRFYLSELSNKNNFSAGYTYTVLSAGIAINYYPIHWAIEPYIGLGLFYNSNNITQDGNASPFFDGTVHSPSYIKNNFSSEITGGIKFSANTPINFIVEVTKTFSKPPYDLVILDLNGETPIRTTKKEKLNFNSLFFKLGLLFRI